MKNPKIVHVLANGRKVKSVEGMIVPADNAAYEVIIRSSKKKEVQTA